MVVGILLAAFSLTAEAKRSTRFTNASLNGQYAYQSIGDDHVSVGLGIVTYDGDGETTRRVTVNAPGTEWAVDGSSCSIAWAGTT